MYTLELGMYRFSIDVLSVAFYKKKYFSKRADFNDYPTRHVNDLNLTK